MRGKNAANLQSAVRVDRLEGPWELFQGELREPVKYLSNYLLGEGRPWISD